MSFMDGPECSTSQNPLAQFNKHADEDRSLQYDKLRGAGGSANPSMRSNARVMSSDDQQLMGKFQAGMMDTMAKDMGNMSIHNVQNMHNRPLARAPMNMNMNMNMNNSGWANDFRHRSVSTPSPGLSARNSSSPSLASSRVASISEKSAEAMGPETARWSAEFNQRPANGVLVNPQGYSGGQMQQIPRFTPQLVPYYASSSMVHQHPQPLQSQNKSQSQAGDQQDTWEEQFKKIEEVIDEDQTKDKGKARETLASDEDLTKDESVLEQEETFNEDNFENVWNRLRKEVFDGLEDMDGPGPTWDKHFDQYANAKPSYGEYQFEEENPFLQEDDAYTIGCQLMDSGAKLSSAVLYFEAAVQQDPNHADAWARLGAAQAQNEKEDFSMSALEKCLQINPNHLDAMMYLAVSYTNEGYENAAYAMLEKWLAAKYPEIVDKAREQDPSLSESMDHYRLHKRVTELFIRAAQLSPEGANMDADVQVGLGVLFYGSEEYSKAIDCFNAALTVRPDDPLLWNRLGATLANSNRSEEAIEAYYKALSLRPSFVRARFNLGVSCINIGCYKEAAEHLLSALSLHETDHERTPDEMLNNQSTHIYETLRRVLMVMERLDLMEKVGRDMDLNEFRQYFDF